MVPQSLRYKAEIILKYSHLKTFRERMKSIEFHLSSGRRCCSGISRSDWSPQRALAGTVACDWSAQVTWCVTSPPKFALQRGLFCNSSKVICSHCIWFYYSARPATAAEQRRAVFGWWRKGKRRMCRAWSIRARGLNS